MIDDEPRFTIEACRSCQHGVIWARNTTTKRPAPINAAPAPDGAGNVRVLRLQGIVSYEVVKAERLAAMAPEDRAQLRTSHFATCANAPHWRKS